MQEGRSHNEALQDSNGQWWVLWVLYSLYCGQLRCPSTNTLDVDFSMITLSGHHDQSAHYYYCYCTFRYNERIFDIITEHVISPGICSTDPDPVSACLSLLSKAKLFIKCCLICITTVQVSVVQWKLCCHSWKRIPYLFWIFLSVTLSHIFNILGHIPAYFGKIPLALQFLMDPRFVTKIMSHKIVSISFYFYSSLLFLFSMFFMSH